MNGVSIPVMPFIPVLLLKLQGWDDHRMSRRMDLQAKQHVDVGDIHELLRTAARDRKIHLRNESWLPMSFLAAGEWRVANFIVAHPDSTIYWKHIGMVI